MKLSLHVDIPAEACNLDSGITKHIRDRSSKPASAHGHNLPQWEPIKTPEAHLSVCRVMLYPGYMPLGIHQAPKVLHYGILFKVDEPSFSFDKHWYQGFNTLACPPWDKLDASGRPTGGLFPTAPHPRGLHTKGLERLRDLLALEVAITLNEALCLHHRQHCPPSQEMDSRCNEVRKMHPPARRRAPPRAWSPVAVGRFWVVLGLASWGGFGQNTPLPAEGCHDLFPNVCAWIHVAEKLQTCAENFVDAY